MWRGDSMGLKGRIIVWKPRAGILRPLVEVLGESGIAVGVEMLLLPLSMPRSPWLMCGMENGYVLLLARKAVSRLLVASVVNRATFPVIREQMIEIDLWWLGTLLLSS